MNAVLLVFAAIGMLGTFIFLVTLISVLLFMREEEKLSKFGCKNMGSYETSPFDRAESEGEAIRPRRV